MSVNSISSCLEDATKLSLRVIGTIALSVLGAVSAVAAPIISYVGTKAAFAILSQWSWSVLMTQGIMAGACAFGATFLLSGLTVVVASSAALFIAKQCFNAARQLW